MKKQAEVGQVSQIGVARYLSCWDFWWEYIRELLTTVYKEQLASRVYPVHKQSQATVRRRKVISLNLVLSGTAQGRSEVPYGNKGIWGKSALKKQDAQSLPLFTCENNGRQASFTLAGAGRMLG